MTLCRAARACSWHYLRSQLRRSSLKFIPWAGDEDKDVPGVAAAAAIPESAECGEADDDDDAAHATTDMLASAIVAAAAAAAVDGGAAAAGPADEMSHSDVGDAAPPAAVAVGSDADAAAAAEKSAATEPLWRRPVVSFLPSMKLSYKSLGDRWFPGGGSRRSAASLACALVSTPASTHITL